MCEYIQERRVGDSTDRSKGGIDMGLLRQKAKVGRAGSVH
jgi:hypothetical protein